MSKFGPMVWGKLELVFVVLKFNFFYGLIEPHK